MEHEIICDHSTNRSRGFGFIVFDAEKTVDELLAKKGNKIDLNGTQVSLRWCFLNFREPSFVQHTLIISTGLQLLGAITPYSPDLLFCLSRQLCSYIGGRLLALHSWK